MVKFIIYEKASEEDMHTKKLGSAARFGARYGWKVRKAIWKIEKLYRNRRQICPYCGKRSVKRIASGMFFCKACKTKFTGKAYTVG